jgi:hypothetical protein
MLRPVFFIKRTLSPLAPSLAPLDKKPQADTLILGILAGPRCGRFSAAFLFLGHREVAQPLLLALSFEAAVLFRRCSSACALLPPLPALLYSIAQQTAIRAQSKRYSAGRSPEVVPYPARGV